MILLETITEYTGDESFLTPATETTNQLWAELSEMFQSREKKEFMMLKLRNHLRLMLMELVISIKFRKNHRIQTDKPLKELFSQMAELEWWKMA